MRLLATFMLLALGMTAATAAEPLVGTPTVIDGQTIEVQGKRFRLVGIDAPDLDQKCEIRGRTYACGRVSRTALMDLVAGVSIRCVPQPSDPKQARCSAGGYDLSEGMVFTGWAFAMPRTDNRYRGFETGARKARRGLWKGSFEFPWIWRAARGRSATSN